MIIVGGSAGFLSLIPEQPGMIFRTVFLIPAQRVPVIFGASEGSDETSTHRSNPGSVAQEVQPGDAFKREAGVFSCCLRQERGTAELLKKLQEGRS